MSAASDVILKLLLVGEDKSASAALGKLATKAKTTGEEAKGHIGGIGAAMGAIGGIAAAAGVVNFGKDAINSFKDVGTESIKLSRLTGLNVEDSSRLRFAFQQTGVDGEAAGKALGIFSKGLVSGTAEKALAGIGIASKDSSGHLKSMQDLLPGISDKFKAMPDGPEKTALAMKLFGKSGADLLPFLNKGADGIKSLDDASDKYGLTISGPMADSIKDAKASQKDWDATLQGLSVTFGAVLLPVLTKTLGYVRDNVVPIIQDATGFFSRHADTIGHVIAVVGPIVGIIAGVIGAVRAWTAVQGLLNVVLAMNPIGLIIIGIAALAAGVIWAYQNVGWFKHGVDTAFKAIGDIANWLWNNVLQPVFSLWVKGLGIIMAWMGDLLITLGKIPGFEWATDAGNKMKDAAGKVDEFSTSIKKIPPKAPVSVDVSVNYSAAAVALLGNQRANLKLSRFAAGGRPDVGAPSWVGEDGPELFVPDRPGVIIPAGQSASMAGGGRGINSGGGGVQNVYITVAGDSDPHGAARKIVEELRVLKMINGGSKFAFEA